MTQTIVTDPWLREPRLLLPGKQPLGPVKLDNVHPLAWGIGACIMATRSGMVDIVRNVLPASDSSTERVDKTGYARTYSGTSTYTTFPTYNDYNILGPHTLFIMFDASSYTNYSALAAYQASTTTNGWELRGGKNNNDNQLIFLRFNTSAYSFISTFSLATSTLNTVAVKSDYGLVNTTPRFFYNGTFVNGTYNAGSASGTVGTQSTNPLYIASRPGTATGFNGGIFLFYFWPNRNLSDAEIISLYLDPFQIMVPA